MFSSKYLTIVVKIRTVVVTREDGDRRRWRRWLCKDRNKPFISTFAVHCLQIFKCQPTGFRVFFQPCSSLGIISTATFSLKVCCKRWRRSVNHTSFPQLHVQDPSSRRKTIAFVKGQSVKKIISRCAKTFSSASCMCVERRLKQEKVQGCWFVDGKAVD